MFPQRRQWWRRLIREKAIVQDVEVDGDVDGVVKLALIVEVEAYEDEGVM